MASQFSLRAVASASDCAAMASIYAAAVRSGTATWAYAEEAQSAADFAARWGASRARSLPWTVAVDAAVQDRERGAHSPGAFGLDSIFPLFTLRQPAWRNTATIVADSGAPVFSIINSAVEPWTTALRIAPCSSNRDTVATGAISGAV